VLGKHTLKPGEKTELKAVFDTKNAPGPFEKITTLQTDVPGQAEIELVMTGTVREAPGPKIAVAPRRLDFGVLKINEKKKRTVTVTNPGERPLAVTAVGVKQGSPVGVSAVLPVAVAAGQKADIELIVTVSQPGPFSERVAIESNAKNAPKTGFVILVTGKAE